jgi:hypothetical protein
MRALVRWFHVGLIILTATGAFAFLVRTRFWFPRYIHWLAAIALAIGFGMLAIIPPDAPVNQGNWVGFKQGMVVLLFPAIVYGAFVLYGGQRAAYETRHIAAAMGCPHCGEGIGLAGETCAACGQTIPPRPDAAARDH